MAALLDTLARDPAKGIARILDRSAIAQGGGAAQASFLVAFRPGFEGGRDPAAPPVSPSAYKGMHGYPPSEPAMRSSLFVAGPGLTRRGDLGLVDMRAIAPSIARILGVALPAAEQGPAF